ncbi:hypothetical protein Tco_1396677 [Tanacetum coccineum]
MTVKYLKTSPTVYLWTKHIQRSIPVTSKNSVDASSETTRGLQEVNARRGNNNRHRWTGRYEVVPDIH